MSVYSIYVEKKPAFAAETSKLWADLRDALELQTVSGLRLLHRYLVEGISLSEFQSSIGTIFSNPTTDEAYMGVPRNAGDVVFAVELLPSQFDQRADACEQALAVSLGGNRPTVRYAKVYALQGEVSAEEQEKIKKYLINPVESREISLDIPVSLARPKGEPAPVPVLEGFSALDSQGLEEFRTSYGLAMDLEDLQFCWDYFTNTEQRNPTETELRMIDTYWSDHCRHTTFFTHLEEMVVEDEEINASKERYFALREKLYTDKERPVTLMDLATIGARALKADGILTDHDASEEVNACSVKITVDVDGKDQDWLLMFKNETHNHPTEIEPFGGASTCLGGAIRDPLSGRSYVYQAMRITGAADPTVPVKETLEGKLPQRTLVRTAADGYSSYGNQIGVATGHVRELYHPGYRAKRMELGAVMAATPRENVVREVPAPGDIVLLLGGRTGRDGVGGATGSSQSHTLDSAEESGAEVQKGNAPEERKMLRLFRKPQVAKLIKRSNDFGAGGVSVAIGELADGIFVDLDTVPVKFQGLNGTEVAISESQERMAVVVAPEAVELFKAYAEEENVEATVVAKITEAPRLVMDYRGQRIVDVSREFLDSSGVSKTAKVRIAAPEPLTQQSKEEAAKPLDKEELLELLSALEHSGQKGLVQQFDSTAGGNTVLLPYGGTYELTPAQSMVSKIPLEQGETDTASVMSWGFDPYLSQRSPYHGALFAVIDSAAKMIAAGGSRKKSWLTFQEYFERLDQEAVRWGKPAAALLGALDAQLALGMGSIGGKDSMSGTFEDLHVPPTLVSFAVSVAKASKVVSGEFKEAGHPIYHLTPTYDDNTLPTFESLRKVLDLTEELLEQQAVESIYTVSSGGIARALSLMTLGNRIGAELTVPLTSLPQVGSFILETAVELPALEKYRIGTTQQNPVLAWQTGEATIEELEQAWTGTLAEIFPTETALQKSKTVETYTYQTATPQRSFDRIAKPKVLMPIFPGTHGEYELAKAFTRAGATVEPLVIQNLSKFALHKAYTTFGEALENSHILAIPGGMSLGGEPQGSGKGIAGFLCHPQIKLSIMKFLDVQQGLICGIGEGMNALLQTGLLPYGEYRTLDHTDPAMTLNPIGRYQSDVVRFRVSSNNSPWTSALAVGKVYRMPVGTADGRLVARRPLIDQWAENGQIVGQFVDYHHQPTMDIAHNPVGAVDAIAGLCSPNGRVFGCLGHPERSAEANLYRNLSDYEPMNIFQGAVKYFTK